MRHKAGFTLLEILIALFIFTILSMLLARALQVVISADASTDRHAKQLRALQFTLLRLSRDIEQAIDRPIVNRAGKREPAFFGSKEGFTLTEGGLSDPSGEFLRSGLQRIGYLVKAHTLYRMTWSVLDQAATSRSHLHALLNPVEGVRFQYLDKTGKWQKDYPSRDASEDNPLPLAVSVELELPQWGKLRQVYVIPYQTHKDPQDASTID